MVVGVSAVLYFMLVRYTTGGWWRKGESGFIVAGVFFLPLALMVPLTLGVELSRASEKRKRSKKML